MSVITKQCPDCSRILDTSEFGSDKGTKDGLRYYCKPCNNVRSTLWQERNREHKNKYQKEWNKKNPEKQRKSYLKSMYGLGWEMYLFLYKKQEGLCKICSVPLKLHNTDDDHKETVHIDHCHTTGKIRGLLCNKCNSGLGFFKENQEYLKKAIEYLEETQSDK